jgi:hypothetical protein
MNVFFPVMGIVFFICSFSYDLIKLLESIEKGLQLQAHKWMMGIVLDVLGILFAAALFLGGMSS